MITNRLLIVYNICGISGNENYDFYVMALDLLLAQTPKCDIIVSGCKVQEEIKEQLLFNYGGRLYFNFIEDILPVNVTFNHSVRKMVEKNGKYSGYLYVDSGILVADPNLVDNLYQRFLSGPYGIMSAKSNTDSGFHLWFSQDKTNSFKTDHNELRKIMTTNTYNVFDIPVGKAINGHFDIWSNDILEAYGNLDPDIFASHCTESVLTFVCAAIKRRWGVSLDIEIAHVSGLDGQSSGFSPIEWAAEHGHTIDHPFAIPSILAVFDNPTARRLGLGYEECRSVVVHDPSQYDENGFCVNDELKDYIRDNVYLTKKYFDYDTIDHEFVGC